MTGVQTCALPIYALFSINRWNLASFYYRDHGARDGSAPLDWIRQVLRDADIDCADGEVWLQCFPRLLGYVFNPVSFWFCEDRHAKLRAILVEVNNTFGESHAYLLAHADQRPIQDGELLEARKQFHVSPFFPVEGRYRFRFTQDKQPTRARIDYRDMDGPLLNTAITGQAQALSADAIWRAWVSYPLMTLTLRANEFYKMGLIGHTLRNMDGLIMSINPVRRRFLVILQRSNVLMRRVHALRVVYT